MLVNDATKHLSLANLLDHAVIIHTSAMKT